MTVSIILLHEQISTRSRVIPDSHWKSNLHTAWYVARKDYRLLGSPWSNLAHNVLLAPQNFRVSPVGRGVQFLAYSQRLAKAFENERMGLESSADQQQIAKVYYTGAHVNYPLPISGLNLPRGYRFCVPNVVIALVPYTEPRPLEPDSNVSTL